MFRFFLEKKEPQLAAGKTPRVRVHFLCEFSSTGNGSRIIQATRNPTLDKEMDSCLEVGPIPLELRNL